MKIYKTKQGQTIRIINHSEFAETIDSPERVERVMNELGKDLEIHNSQTAVSYSDEGFACFEIIQNLPHVLILSFMSTAS
jgi:hypothetical protein